MIKHSLWNLLTFSGESGPYLLEQGAYVALKIFPVSPRVFVQP